MTQPEIKPRIITAPVAAFAKRNKLWTPSTALQKKWGNDEIAMALSTEPEQIKQMLVKCFIADSIEQDRIKKENQPATVKIDEAIKRLSNARKLKSVSKRIDEYTSVLHSVLYARKNGKQDRLFIGGFIDKLLK